MILLSTSATMRFMSPAWMAGSALIVVSTSLEIRLTRASGASSAAMAGNARLARDREVAASQWRRCIMCFLSGAGGDTGKVFIVGV